MMKVEHYRMVGGMLLFYRCPSPSSLPVTPSLGRLDFVFLSSFIEKSRLQYYRRQLQRDVLIEMFVEAAGAMNDGISRYHEDMLLVIIMPKCKRYQQ